MVDTFNLNPEHQTPSQGELFPVEPERLSVDQLGRLMANLDIYEHPDPVIRNQMRSAAVLEAIDKPETVEDTITALESAKQRKLAKRTTAEMIADSRGAEETPDTSGAGITYYSDDEDPFHDDKSPDLKEPLLPITIDFDDKKVPKDMTTVVSSLPVPITAEFLDNFDLDSDEQTEGQRSVIGGLVNAVRNGIDRLPPLVSTGEDMFVPTTKPIHELTPEERAIVEYEDAAVARPFDRLARGLGLRDLPTPEVAERDIKLHNIWLKAKLQEQQPGHELLDDKGEEK